VALRRLLDLCDELHRIRDKMSDPELVREARTRLRRQSKRKSVQLTRDLSAYRFRGPLGQVMREYRFTPADFEALAVLLHRTMRSEDPAMEGRLILASIFETSFEVLAGMNVLHAGGRLRSSGLVQLVDDEEDDASDLLSARFRLSDEALQAFREEIAGVVPEDLQRRKVGGYQNNREFLVDLRILHNLYKGRSERVFHHERWDRLHAGSTVPGRSLTQRIERFWSRIHRRLRDNPEAKEFPAVKALRAWNVSEEETVMIVHLLFKELYEGNAYADAVELIRLVSHDEAELIRNKRLMAPSGNLLARGLLQLESMIEGRELTGEVHLADWAVNALFGHSAAEESIRPDERLEWHLYLKSLEDTAQFFEGLENS